MNEIMRNYPQKLNDSLNHGSGSKMQHKKGVKKESDKKK